MTTREVLCPRCHHRLLLAPGPSAGLTCPRCLAAVPDPEAVTTAPAASPPVRPACPRCGRDIEEAWVACPYCREQLRGPRRWWGAGFLRPVDVDVRRDSRGTGASLGLLTLLGAVGVCYALAVSVRSLRQGEAQPMAVTLLLLLCAGVVTAFVVFSRQPPQRGPEGVKNVVVGTLAVVGAVIASCAVAVVAVIAFFMVVCLASGMK